MWAEGASLQVLKAEQSMACLALPLGPAWQAGAAFRLVWQAKPQWAWRGPASPPAWSYCVLAVEVLQSVWQVEPVSQLGRLLCALAAAAVSRLAQRVWLLSSLAE